MLDNLGLPRIWSLPASLCGCCENESRRAAGPRGYAATLGGGLLGGDAVSIDIEVGAGERWQFHEYRSPTRIWRGGELVLHHGLVLLLEDGDLAGCMDRFNCLATAVLCGPALATTSARLLGSLAAAAVLRRADMLLAAAPLSGDGVLLRAAGLLAEHVGTSLRQYLAIVPAL